VSIPLVQRNLSASTQTVGTYGAKNGTLHLASVSPCATRLALNFACGILEVYEVVMNAEGRYVEAVTFLASTRAER